jgi:hypothetical protein
MSERTEAFNNTPRRTSSSCAQFDWLICLETLSSRSLALEEAHRIERRRAPADLEVQLRRVDIAGLARVRNYLPALDLVTTLHQQFLGMRVDGGVAIRVADEDKVALARKCVACIADDAILGGRKASPRAPRGRCRRFARHSARSRS